VCEAGAVGCTPRRAIAISFLLVAGACSDAAPDATSARSSTSEASTPSSARVARPTSTTRATAPDPTVTTAAPPSVPPGDDTTIERVVDGDTIVVAGGVRVRLIGIDTPESVDPRTTVECFGREAARRAAELLPPGAGVRLVYDVERLDRFGRTLAYVYRADGSFVNEALVRDGFAFAFTVPPNVAHAEDFARWQAEAREAGRGLWSACPLGGASATTLPAGPGGCDPSYPDACIPPPPPDLDCGDVAPRRFRVVPPDPHRFDGDHDGVGCE
jgi:micrococcal nuclease